MEFKVGDRVRVYFGNRKYVREIERIEVKTGILEMTREWEYYGSTYCGAHPKQCRRLKPKPKAKKEARRVWIERDSLEEICPPLAYYCREDGRIEFREVLPGETVITRESLEKAWDEVFGSSAYSRTRAQITYARFSQALGLNP